MPIKISQLPALTVVDGTVLVPVVDVSGAPVSKRTTATTLATYILSGNAATATKLATARTINGVSFDGTASITISATTPTASTTVLGGVIIPVVGTSGITNSSGTIGLATATTTQLGGVKVDGSTITISGSGVISGSQLYTLPAATSSTIGGVIKGNGLQVKNDGTLSTTTTPSFHGFVVNANGDLEYTKMTSGDLAVANGDATEQYVMWEIGTSDYSWQITADGILQIQYTDSDI